MLNQLIIVGRLTDKPVLQDKVCYITLAVPRSFRNESGVYETDFIQCELREGVAKNTVEYCEKGDTVGVKGRIETVNNSIKIIAEKVTFLSTHRNENIQ